MERMSDILAKTISQRARQQRNEQRGEQTPRRTSARPVPSGQAPQTKNASDSSSAEQHTPTPSAPRTPAPMPGLSRPTSSRLTPSRLRSSPPGRDNPVRTPARTLGTSMAATPPATPTEPVGADETSSAASGQLPTPAPAPQRRSTMPSHRAAQYAQASADTMLTPSSLTPQTTPHPAMVAAPAPGNPRSLAARASADTHELPGSDQQGDGGMADRVLELPARRTPTARASIPAASASDGRYSSQPTQPTQPTPAPQSSRLPTQSGRPPAPQGQPAPADALPARTTRQPRGGQGAPKPLDDARTRNSENVGGMSSLHELAADYTARLAHRAAQAPRQVAQNDSMVPDDADDQPYDDLSPAERADVTTPDVCPICHGAGYVRIDVPLGDPSFGQAVPCECKERAREEKRRSELSQLSSLAPFRGKTFETYDVRLPGVAEAYQVAQRYAETMEGWLVLSGGYGVGKTHLAAAIANEQLVRGTPVFFSAVPDLLDHLRATFAPSSEVTYDALFDRIREVELLVLDDLGAESSTAWATEKLFQLLNYRYNYRMPTVFTTNRKLIDHLDERIRSRLSDLSLVRHVNIQAADFRERHAGRAPRAVRNQGSVGADAGGTPSGNTGGNTGGRTSGNTGGRASGGRGNAGGNLPPRGRNDWR